MTQIVATLDALHHTCAADGRFDACTNFISYRLETHCSHQRSWRVDARATFRPWIHLYNIRQLPHEVLHVGDVRGSVERYAAALEQAEFASAADCQAAALIASGRFEQRMLEFARASNALRHPRSR